MRKRNRIDGRFEDDTNLALAYLKSSIMTPCITRWGSICITVPLAGR
jgi:hypothetical protein